MAEVVKRSWRVALVIGTNETVVDDADSPTAAVVAIHGPVYLEVRAGRRDDATWWAREIGEDGDLTGPTFSLREKW